MNDMNVSTHIEMCVETLQTCTPGDFERFFYWLSVEVAEKCPEADFAQITVIDPNGRQGGAISWLSPYRPKVVYMRGAETESYECRGPWGRMAGH